MYLKAATAQRRSTPRHLVRNDGAGVAVKKVQAFTISDAPMSSGGRRTVDSCVAPTALVVQETSIDLI